MKWVAKLEAVQLHCAHYTAQHDTALHCIPLHLTTLLCAAPHCIELTLHSTPIRNMHPTPQLTQHLTALQFKQTNKLTTNNNDLLEKDGGTKNCIYKD